MLHHIVFIINSLDSRSGSERVACLLANLFSNQSKYKVTIINRKTEFDDVAYELNKVIEVKKITGNAFIFLKKVQSYIEVNNPRTIIIHNMGKLSLLCAFLNKKNSKLISLEHGAFTSRPYYIKKISNFIYVRFDKVVVLNEFDKLEISKINPNTVKIYNPSPFNDLKLNDYDRKRKTVVALGRLHPEKNFEHLIISWGLLGERTNGWTLKIYGIGEQYRLLKNLIISLNITNIRLMGEVKNVSRVYAEAALYVMTSKNEGLPMVLIEAQSYGIPIISYNCPHGPSEIISHNIDGILVENQNVEKFSKNLNLLLKSYKLRKILSNGALKSSLRFSNDKILLEWELIL